MIEDIRRIARFAGPHDGKQGQLDRKEQNQQQPQIKRRKGLTHQREDAADIVGKLGPEPLEDDFSTELLQQLFHGRRRVLKPLLLDQTFIAGLGNIYADEALHYAGIHPQRRSDTLAVEEINALHAGIRKALELGVAREGASIDNYRKPDGTKGDMQNAIVAYGRTGQPCYRCQGTIERIVLGGRSTHFCAGCLF